MKKKDCTTGPSYCPNCGREMPSAKFCISCNINKKSKYKQIKLKHKK